MFNAEDNMCAGDSGANDKHLSFRSCVTVEIVNDHQVDIIFGTRVHCTNLFGRFYMGCY